MLCCVVSLAKEYLLFYDVRQDVLQLCYAVMCHTTFYTECVYTQPCIERPWNTTTSAPHHPVRQQHPIQTQCYTYRCCMFVSCVHPLAVLNLAFGMTCSLLMLIKDAGGYHMEEAYFRAGLITALSVSFVYPILLWLVGLLFVEACLSTQNLDLKDAILFVQCLLFCVHFHYCMCVMCLMSFDGFF